MNLFTGFLCFTDEGSHSTKGMHSGMPKSRGTWHIVTNQREQKQGGSIAAPHQGLNEMASTKVLIEAFAPVLVAFHPSRALVNHDRTHMVFAAP